MSGDLLPIPGEDILWKQFLTDRKQKAQEERESSSQQDETANQACLISHIHLFLDILLLIAYFYV
jgi:hypothetical protein